MKQKFEQYPKIVLPRLKHLRGLFFETARDCKISDLEETLKWGEPSYLTKHGSTIRLDWKVKTPKQYAIYFKCTTQLVPTFKAVYGDLFTYEKHRAILFQLEDSIPEKELKACIRLGLTYHKVKQLPLLGLQN